MVKWSVVPVVVVLACSARAEEKVSTKIEFRGVPVRAAFEELSKALQERVIVSRQVPAETLDQDIRMQTEHLAPEQAIRWVARLVGLGAVHTREGYYVALPEQLRAMNLAAEVPAAVLLAAPADAPQAPARSAGDELAGLLARSGPVFWQDAPLSRVAADVARVYQIDLIVHPGVAEQGALMEWEQPQVSLGDTCRRLSEVFTAGVSYQDGALYLHAMEASLPVPAASAPAAPTSTRPAPPALTTRPASPPSQASPQPGVVEPATRTIETRPSPEQSGPPPQAVGSPPGRLTVDASIRDWPSFARHLETATGWPCQLRESGRPYVPMDIDGPAGSVLEAMRLMGLIDYRCIRPKASAAPTIEVRVRPGRSLF